MLGKPTHPSKMVGREVWVRRGGTGNSHTGTRTQSARDFSPKEKAVYVRPARMPRWAKKYLPKSP